MKHMEQGVWREEVGKPLQVFFHSGASPHFPKLSADFRKTAQPDTSHLGMVSPYLPRPSSLCSFVTHPRPSLCLV